MDEQTYMASRVEGQIKWMGSKAASNKKTYRALRTISLLASVLIPLLSGFSDKFGMSMTLTIGALGALVAICQGLLALNRNHENWTEYRLSAEALQREKLFYETGTAPYNGDGRFNLFVGNVEALLSGENRKWLANNKDLEKGGK